MSNILYSYTFQDVRGDKKSFAVYGQFDEAARTIAELITYAGDMALTLDAVTGGKIISSGMTIFPTLPVGLKAAPEAGSDVQQTGLISFPLANLPSKIFSYDIPSWADALANTTDIDLTQADVAAFVGLVSGVGGDVVVVNDIWSTALLDATKGTVSFRKHKR